jgi:hypothetical protein
MTFTDDDLKRLKEDLQERKDDHYELAGRLDIESMEALLARLEAAEILIEAFMDREGMGPFWKEEYEAWRKAAGK